jgi:hypothetical protein
LLAARGLPLDWKEALSMTVQHADLFHCLACGRVAYEPHGGTAPDCCGQPMVRAVADVEREMPPSGAADSASRAGDEEHALFAELVELAQWCHRQRDVDVSRTEELANRLSVLRQALIDQIEDTRYASSGMAEASSQVISERPREQGQQLLSTFARFVAQLRNGPSPFGSWSQICDRLGEVVADFRQYVETESQLSHFSSTKKGNSAR